MDSDQFADLSGEIDGVLGQIRAAFPELPQVLARPPYVPSHIGLGLDNTFADTLDPAIWDAHSWPPISFGREDMDLLNERLGLRGLIFPHRYEEGASVYLCLDSLVNIPAAIHAYKDILVVRYAGPDSLVGDSTDIAIRQEVDAWYVVFRDAWGDCPAGCIEQRLHYFIADGVPRQVPEADALRDPILRELAETWGAQRLPSALPSPVPSPSPAPRTGGR
ncbi:MAG: hypothetical protein Q7T33_04100 [Dehalococcoidia bacterium]|nr:hypothetical protein [Dehalococcoidia bacterium]